MTAMIAQMPLHLFVYGTLRSAAQHPQHALIGAAADLIGGAVLEGRLFDCGEYPGAVWQAGADTWVVGELFAVRGAHAASGLFDALDRYEACSPTDPTPHEFTRSICPVRLATGMTLPAWVYLYAWDTAKLPPIHSGDYLTNPQRF